MLRPANTVMESGACPSCIFRFLQPGPRHVPQVPQRHASQAEVSSAQPLPLLIVRAQPLHRRSTSEQHGSTALQQLLPSCSMCTAEISSISLVHGGPCGGFLPRAISKPRHNNHSACCLLPAIRLFGSPHMLLLAVPFPPWPPPGSAAPQPCCSAPGVRERGLFDADQSRLVADACRTARQ